MPEITYSRYPKARIYLGGCVERGDGSSFRHHAHAHTDRKSKYHGWICFRSFKPSDVFMYDGSPSDTLKHEYAHILTGQGHTRVWAQQFKDLGGNVRNLWYPKRKTVGWDVSPTGRIVAKQT